MQFPRDLHPLILSYLEVCKTCLCFETGDHHECLSCAEINHDVCLTSGRTECFPSCDQFAFELRLDELFTIYKYQKEEESGRWRLVLRRAGTASQTAWKKVGPSSSPESSHCCTSKTNTLFISHSTAKKGTRSMECIPVNDIVFESWEDWRMDLDKIVLQLDLISRVALTEIWATHCKLLCLKHKRRRQRKWLRIPISGMFNS